MFCLMFLTTGKAYAQERRPDQACILCHTNTDQVLTLPSREVLDLNVNLTELEGSLHGTHSGVEGEGLIYCTDCHRNSTLYRYPHEPNPAQTRRDFAAAVSENCATCHTPIELHNPGHLQAQSQTGLPTCTDCHGGHDVAAIGGPDYDPVAFCQSCHQTYQDQHVGEVHAELVANFGPGQDCQMCHGEVQQAADAKCKACHGLLDTQLELSTDQTINLHVDPNVIMGSVHGEREVQGVPYQALKCTDCHVDQARYGFPHPRLTETTQRGVTVEMERVCKDCHQEIYAKQQDGVHQHAIEQGNLDAATCADCHGNHDIQVPDVPARTHLQDLFKVSLDDQRPI